MGSRCEGSLWEIYGWESWFRVQSANDETPYIKTWPCSWQRRFPSRNLTAVVSHIRRFPTALRLSVVFLSAFCPTQLALLSSLPLTLNWDGHSPPGHRDFSWFLNTPKKRQSFARSTIPMLLLEPLFADPNGAQDYTKAIDIWRSRPVSELLGLHCLRDVAGMIWMSLT